MFCFSLNTQMHMDENISEEMLNRRFNSKKRARDDTHDTVKTGKLHRSLFLWGRNDHASELFSLLGEATASAISKLLQAAHFGVKYENTDSGAALTLLCLPGAAKTVRMRDLLCPVIAN